jgi:hypothetical protein
MLSNGGVARAPLALAGALLLLGLLAGHPAVAAEGEWQAVEPDTFPIVSQYAPLEEAPLAMASSNDLGGKSIEVAFSYAGGAFSRVAYNEFPTRQSRPSMDIAAQVVLRTSPLFKDGDFSLGELGRVASPLGDFDFQLVHAGRPTVDGRLLSCAVFYQMRPASMGAISGYFCSDSAVLDNAELGMFFGKLGIRGIGMPE